MRRMESETWLEGPGETPVLLFYWEWASSPSSFRWVFSEARIPGVVFLQVRSNWGPGAR